MQKHIRLDMEELYHQSHGNIRLTLHTFGRRSGGTGGAIASQCLRPDSSLIES